MFTAKIYKICIASASGAMKEERIAQDVVARWNCQNGETKGTIYLQVPQEMAPDVYVFVVDNFVDTAKIDAAIATGARVVLFFADYHDANNTMASELKTIVDFREKIQNSCVCIDYKNSAEFVQRFTEFLESLVSR